MNTTVPEPFIEQHESDDEFFDSLFPDPPDPFPNLPATLKQIPNWIRWQLEERDGKQTKVPYVVGTTRPAAINKPADWVRFRTAIGSVPTISDSEGLGFVINGKAAELGLVGFDIDGCRNSQSGEITEWAWRLIKWLHSYTEVTPSGTGVRVWVIGELPEGRRVFSLSPSAGYGDKVRVEVFSQGRYFTITGDRIGDATDIERRNLLDAYRLCDEIKRQFPSAHKPTQPGSADDGDAGPVRIKSTGSVITTKLELLMHGNITQDRPLVIEDGLGNSLEYPSHSEADLALATWLAIDGKDAEGIAEAFRESALYRRKFERPDYREKLIRKALESAQEWKPTNQQIVLQANETVVPLPEGIDPNSVAAIPPFDPSVINGIYAKFVDLITRGATLAPQFAYVIAKTVVGARMAGKVKFKNLDAEPRYYTALIGETGSGKGEAWRRMLKILQASGLISGCGIKIINSADSGAGIKDLFFDPPQDEPVLCYVDEIEGLGNKASATRNPAIIDTMIELADCTSISRVLAKKNQKREASRTTNDARFCMVICGQDGETYMKAFAGRTKLGIYDRLYPEFGVAVEPGNLPDIDASEAGKLMGELLGLDYSSEMEMSQEAETRLEEFWTEQPKEVRVKVRWKKNLAMDAFMSGFGRGSKIAELQDMEIAIKIFTRQLFIRRVCFSTEVPDRVGFYLGAIKKITERMQRQLDAGVLPQQVAKSRRDYENETHAYRNNEEHIFGRAWDAHVKVHLQEITIEKGNKQRYAKYLPIPPE
jgi:putative DNA primase/helicase